MSFNFNWNFDEAFYQNLKCNLEESLNNAHSQTKSKIIAGRIEVLDFSLGDVPPVLELVDISDLSANKFKGLFKLLYSGNALIHLSANVQANPVTCSDEMSNLDVTVAANNDFYIPIKLKLSELNLKGFISVMYKKENTSSLNVSFKGNPVKSIKVSSTFDKYKLLSKFIQTQVDKKLEQFFEYEFTNIVSAIYQKYYNQSKLEKSKIISSTARKPALRFFSEPIKTRRLLSPTNSLLETGRVFYQNNGLSIWNKMQSTYNTLKPKLTNTKGFKSIQETHLSNVKDNKLREKDLKNGFKAIL